MSIFTIIAATPAEAIGEVVDFYGHEVTRLDGELRRQTTVNGCRRAEALRNYAREQAEFWKGIVIDDGSPPMQNEAHKALTALAALDKLSEEYADRPDVQHAIGEFIQDASPSTMARFFDLVTSSETKAEALATLNKKD